MADPQLVRDHVPELMVADGTEPEVRVLDSDAEFRAALVAKLLDETRGLAELVDGRREGEVVAELADVLEVLRAVAECEGATWAQVEHEATTKRFHRGSFSDRVAVVPSEQVPPEQIPS